MWAWGRTAGRRLAVPRGTDADLRDCEGYDETRSSIEVGAACRSASAAAGPGGRPLHRRGADIPQERYRAADLGDQAAARRRARNDGRRHHGIPPAERPAGAVIPGPGQRRHIRQPHLPGRLAPRELRRDRHGAFAGAPALQGHAQASQHLEGVQRPRGAGKRDDALRPDQLLRRLLRNRREPGMGAGTGSGPHGQLLHRQDGPGQRDDRGAQRAGGQGEQPHLGAGGAGAGNRVRMAQLRQGRPGRPRRCRERPDRQAAGLLQDVLPAGQRGADRGGQDLRAEGHRPRPQAFRPHSEA